MGRGGAYPGGSDRSSGEKKRLALEGEGRDSNTRRRQAISNNKNVINGRNESKKKIGVKHRKRGGTVSRADLKFQPNT